MEDRQTEEEMLLATLGEANQPQNTMNRINPIEVSPAIEKNQSKPLVSDKKTYWRDQIKAGKDPRDVLNEYLMDLSARNERSISPEALNQDRQQRQENFETNANLDLTKSLADFGASFANRRYIDPNSKIPTSGFNPENQKKYLAGYQKSMADEQNHIGQVQGIDQKILQYLAEKKAAQEKEKADRDLKIQLAKVRDQNDPFKAMMMSIRQAEEQRQKGEYEMKKEAHEQKTEENRRKYNPSNVQEKLQNMNSTEKQQVGFVTSGLKSLNELNQAEMEGRKSHATNGFFDSAHSAIGAAPWRYNLLGDNKYTAAANRYKEFFGRMESGGAITGDETKSFLSLVPTVLDSPEIADEKLQKMKEMFYQKANILGLDLKDVDELMGHGVAPVNIKGEDNQDEKALQWYKDPNNQSDPNYKAVGDKLRKRGLIK